MIKKVLIYSLVFITLFYLNCNVVLGYEYENPNNESKVKNMINDIFDLKQQYEDLIGYGDNEENIEIYSSNNSNYWWPIGSVETTEQNGVLFASGEPETVYVSSAFGVRTYKGVTKVHRGTDISGGTYSQTNVIAAKDGVVVYPLSLDGNNCPDSRVNSSACTDYGNYVKIQHADGNYTVYGHLYENSITVKAGDHVVQGQVIGKMGSSGNSSGPHLHFEIRFGTDAYSASQPTVGEYIFPENPRPFAANVVSGTDSQQTICLTLKQSGFPDNGVAGILTNIYHESGFIPNNLEGSYEGILGFTDETYTAAVDDGSYSSEKFIHDSAGYGIVQWTYYTLKSGLYNFVKEKGTSIGDVNTQLQFLTHELETDFAAVGNYLKNVSNSSSDTTYYFCRNFENPQNAATTCANRMSNASKYESYVKNECSN